MIELAGVDALVVDSHAAGGILGLPPHTAVTVVAEAALPQRADPVMPCAATPGACAYVLFTSGSTGEPKGVPITHANAVAFIANARETIAVGPDDRYSCTFDLTFDLSVFDMFVPWSTGGALVVGLPADKLSPVAYANGCALSVWFSVPSVIAQAQLVGDLRPDSLPGLRWSIFCGERLPALAADRWAAASPNSTVVNLYGPTELTIAISSHFHEPGESAAGGSVPIGRVFPDHDAILVLDGKRTKDRGELCIAGPQCFAGYLDPAQDEGRFHEESSRRWYRTGDIAELRDAGDLVWLGRVDDQVKVRGFRVEISEVETALLRTPGVAEAAVVLCGDSDGDQELRAYVTASDGEHGAEWMLRHACNDLPYYMHPAGLELLDSIPKNANGKIDRRVLRGRGLRTVSQGARGSVLRPEEVVAGIAAGELGLHPREVDASCGLYLTPTWDSRRHIQIFARIEERLGIRFDNRQLFTLRTLDQIMAECYRLLDERDVPQRVDGAVKADTIRHGLDGVILDTTTISYIDGAAGRLSFRGRDIEDIVSSVGFHEVIALILGEPVPAPDGLWNVDPALLDLLDDVIKMEMTVGGGATAAVSAGLRLCRNDAPHQELLRTYYLVGLVARSLAMYDALVRGVASPEAPRCGNDIAAQMLHWVTGGSDPVSCAALNSALTIQAEHGSNASTFSARIVASVGADDFRALEAAVCAFSGPRHGGATADVVEFLDAVIAAGSAAPVIHAYRVVGRGIPGFGHRLYRTQDPRAAILRRILKQDLIGRPGVPERLSAIDSIIAELGRELELGLGENVDLYAGVLYEAVGLPRHLFVPLFMLARIPGWMAHVREQRQRDFIIRPDLKYVGPVAQAHA